MHAGPEFLRVHTGRSGRNTRAMPCHVRELFWVVCAVRNTIADERVRAHSRCMNNECLTYAGTRLRDSLRVPLTFAMEIE